MGNMVCISREFLMVLTHEEVRFLLDGGAAVIADTVVTRKPAISKPAV